MDGSLPVEAANSRFHAEYDVARERESLDVVVLVVMADELVLVNHGERLSISFSPEEFHVFKTVAHVAIAAYTASRLIGASSVADACERSLRTLVGAVDSLRAPAERLGRTAGGDAGENLLQLLAVTGQYLRHILEGRRVDPPALSGFARGVGPRLLQCTKDATRVQLAALHAHATPLIHRLDAEEQRSLQVVVLGDHQARVRSLGMQYFQRLLGERPGEERRVTYGEGISTLEEALELVGTRRFDRILAKAFFDDPTRLQRDILGDAVKEQLGRFELSPIP